MNTTSTASANHTDSTHKCFHCGEDCQENTIQFDDHSFCCEGCVTVYDILIENDLCRYYDIEQAQGISPEKSFFKGKFDHLDLPEVKEKLIEFTDGTLAQVNWLIPKMHCSSCIWLLEQLYKLNPAVRNSLVNFPEKNVRITYDATKIKLSQIAELLTSVGYEPYISLNDVAGRQLKKWNKTRLYKIGIAGFAFGNIMMLSFPEYFSLGLDSPDSRLRMVFDWLNFALSLPVLVYCASDFFKSAWTALKGWYLNIDTPIALALLCVFLTSLYQISFHTGPGYFDSLTGAVFFMLIGRYFQDKTYSGISFERDYKSYFPVAVSTLVDGIERRKPVTTLMPGEKILVRNSELIPCDAVLMSARAMIDYSFVSGEALPVDRSRGDTIYAGAKQTGPAIELEVLREVSQSYLTQLWNNDSFSRIKEDQQKTLAARINKYFSAVVLAIAALTFLYWLMVRDQPQTAFLAFTTCLLVACPCALVLSSTFTHGNLLALFGKNRFYPKNSHAIERLSKIDTVVFDKTGTITRVDDAEVTFIGNTLSENELVMVKTVALQSSHPLSRMIVTALSGVTASKRVLMGFAETPGEGMSALWNTKKIRLGSAHWVGTIHTALDESSVVYLAIDGNLLGYFSIRSRYRPDLAYTIARLQNEGIGTYLLSGDKATDKNLLEPIFGQQDHLLFEQKPEEKLGFIKHLQQDKNLNVLMVGDGLNDAGALRQSNVGIAVSDDINNFSPACDAIIEGSQLSRLPAYINLARSGQRIIKMSFALSLCYNIFGLAFAITGNLSPVVAAILMPISSISIVIFTTVASNLAAARWMKTD